MTTNRLQINTFDESAALGDYDVIITLTDDNLLNPQTTEFVMTIKILSRDAELISSTEDLSHLWEAPMAYGEERALTAKIASIDRVGRVNVRFSEAIVKIEDCEDVVDRDVLELDLVQHFRGFDGERDYEWSWSCVSVGGSMMVLQLEFDRPELVSQTFRADELSVIFLKSEYFTTYEGRWPLSEDY